MAISPEEFLKKVVEDRNTCPNEDFVLDSLTPWIESYGEEGFEKFIEALEDDIWVIREVHSRYLRERDKS